MVVSKRNKGVEAQRVVMMLLGVNPIVDSRTGSCHHQSAPTCNEEVIDALVNVFKVFAHFRKL